MSDLSIPGVTDKYGTKDMIKGLMELERVPLEREETRLEEFHTEQSAWRDINTQMSTLRETAKNLYSFDNPFSLKIATSSDEDAITASPDRDAGFDTFKIEVLQTATADRFLSDSIESDRKIPAGEYAFRVNEKTIKLNWKGGNLEDFVTAINKRSSDTIKASLIGITKDTKVLLIESLLTGSENKLYFDGESEQFGKDIGMLVDAPVRQSAEFPVTKANMKNTGKLFSSTIEITDTSILLPPTTGFQTTIPLEAKGDAGNVIKFSASLVAVPVENLVEENAPNLPSSGFVRFNGITVNNESHDIELPKGAELKPEPVIPVEDYSSIFVKTNVGIEIPLEQLRSDGESIDFEIPIDEYPTIESIVIKNNNSHKELVLSPFEIVNKDAERTYVAKNVVEEALDAVIKYQGITISRPTNEIDDVVPSITLNVHAPTEKPATISINPDVEQAKDYLLTFTAQYNRLIAELNIVTQTKEEVISELTYFDDDEVEKAEERLGMFQGEFSLTNIKNSLQAITASAYVPGEDAEINLLSQIGISTSASSGGFSGISASRLRGYLEINEDTLDKALEKNIIDIKNLFGYDTNDDLVIDSGIAYKIDQQLQAYTQTGGIIATKNTSLESQIKNSETKIASLEEKLEEKEQRLNIEFGQMESALSSLDSQTSALENFNNQNSGK